MRIGLSALAILINLVAFSQVECYVSVTPTNATICPGDSIMISALASVTSGGQSFDFDSGTLPPGWSTTGSTVYSTPCGAGPNGSPYFWASTSGTSTPTVTTAGFDVECGGSIVFEMMYAVQSGSSPCEGPDLADEGVELQYSVDGGLTWITIVYYSPGGYELPSNPGTSGSVASGPTPYTVWNQFTVPIPPGAMTTNTMFQWIQTESSGTCCDNWGLEDISIQAGPCESAVVNWSNGLTDTTSFYATPTTDTTFVAYVYDTLGNLQCMSDTILISLNTASLTYDLVDTVYAFCPTDIIPVEVTNMANSVTPYSFQWSNGTTTNPTDLYTNGNPQDTIPYYVEITDACGFVYNDSVIMIVNQTLSIDTLISYPSSACVPNGAVSAMVSGQTGVPYYNWTGPGPNNPAFIQATVWQNISPGWYYFTATDNVCEVSDSIYVDPLNPPIASMTPSTTGGCAPLTVTFTNNSQNTTSYEWQFGNGSPNVNTTSMNSQTSVFSSTSTVMLIAYDMNNCADTAFATIDIVQCGCTDPLANNYNPNAIVDDGSCIYPVPEVSGPNVFTPNGDGDNDLFFLTTKFTEELELTITNRWGNVVYQGTGPNPAWDGKSQNGAEVAEGVYFFRYKAYGVLGDLVEGHGFLHLIRD